MNDYIRVVVNRGNGLWPGIVIEYVDHNRFWGRYALCGMSSKLIYRDVVAHRRNRFDENLICCISAIGALGFPAE